MTLLSRILTTTAPVAIAVSIAGTSVMADIKSEDVWNSIARYYGALGVTLDAIQTREGNTLVLTALKASATFPYNMGSATLTTSGFTLIDNTDGSVTFQMEASVPVAIAVILPDGNAATATLSYAQTGYNVRATGDPDNITILYSIDSITGTLGELDFPDMPEMDINFDLVMNGFDAEISLTDGETLGYVQTSRMAELIYGGTINFANVEDSAQPAAQMKLDSITKNYASSFTASLPKTGIDLENLPAQLRDGLSLTAHSTSDSAVSTDITTSGGIVIARQNSTSGPSVSDMTLSADGVAVDASIESFSLDMIIEELPFPIIAEADTITATASFPLLQNDTPQDVNYRFNLQGITINDDLWALFDPTNALPRDPATIALDLTAKARLFLDLMNIPAMTRLTKGDGTLGELDALTLNSLTVSAAGAALTGNGAFTFDNSDTTTFDGFPAPIGSATFNLSGANALIDTLIKMGLVQEDDAMGARMMMGIFMKPGNGDDTLTSTIDVTPDGHISANGQRLK